MADAGDDLAEFEDFIASASADAGPAVAQTLTAQEQRELRRNLDESRRVRELEVTSQREEEADREEEQRRRLESKAATQQRPPEGVDETVAAEPPLAGAQPGAWFVAAAGWGHDFCSSRARAEGALTAWKVPTAWLAAARAGDAAGALAVLSFPISAQSFTDLGRDGPVPELLDLLVAQAASAREPRLADAARACFLAHALAPPSPGHSGARRTGRRRPTGRVGVAPLLRGLVAAGMSETALAHAAARTRAGGVAPVAAPAQWAWHGAVAPGAGAAAGSALEPSNGVGLSAMLATATELARGGALSAADTATCLSVAFALLAAPAAAAAAVPAARALVAGAVPALCSPSQPPADVIPIDSDSDSGGGGGGAASPAGRGVAGWTLDRVAALFMATSRGGDAPTLPVAAVCDAVLRLPASDALLRDLRAGVARAVLRRRVVPQLLAWAGAGAGVGVGAGTGFDAPLSEGEVAHVLWLAGALARLSGCRSRLGTDEGVAAAAALVGEGAGPDLDAALRGGTCLPTATVPVWYALRAAAVLLVYVALQGRAVLGEAARPHRAAPTLPAAGARLVRAGLEVLARQQPPSIHEAATVAEARRVRGSIPLARLLVFLAPCSLVARPVPRSTRSR